MGITFPVRREEDRDPGNPAPRSTLQNRLAVFWEFRSLKPGRRCAPCGTTGPRSFFQLLAILGSFRSFTEGGAAAPSKPGRLPARFWQVSTIKPGNVAFLFSFSILILIYASRHLLSRARAKYLFPPFPPLSVEGFPGAPGGYSDSPKSPKIVNVY